MPETIEEYHKATSNTPASHMNSFVVAVYSGSTCASHTHVHLVQYHTRLGAQYKYIGTTLVLFWWECYRVAATLDSNSQMLRLVHLL